MTPRVTVLMSVYNGQRYVAEAVDSILAQTFADFELLIIDDASSDRTAEILASYDDPRIRVLRNETNLGLTKSLNRGLQEARGELIARHDADDRSHPERLAEQVAFLDAHPEAAVVGAQANHIDESGRKRGSSRHPLSAAASRFSMMFGSALVHGAAMFRRSIVRDLGGYDESYITGQDADLWSRIIPLAEVRNLDRVLIDFRVHAESVSATRYTPENLRRLEAVLRRSVLTATGDAALADEWPALAVAIVNTAIQPRPEQPERAIAMIDKLRERFLAREPQARGDRDIDRIYGNAQLIIASYLASRDRGAAASAVGRALFAAPVATSHALPRIAAFALFGARAQALRRFRR
jgi:glycosyltransferase involved in cell wall biosynthesis